MTHRLTFLCLFLVVPDLFACSFCGGNPFGRSTLREEFARADAVVAGTLKNPQLGSDPTSGTTEFHLGTPLKSHDICAKRPMIVLPKYMAPGEAIIFFAVRGGQPDPVRIQTSTAALATYLAGAGKFAEKDIAGRLGFAFAHLDSTDETVSDDAFLEFAKATDAEITLAKPKLDATKLKLMLKNPKTLAGRIGVYALLLGLCGDKADASVLAGMLIGKQDSSLGGILTGMAMLDSGAGWPAINAILCDGKRDFGERLSARSAVHYFHATRPAESQTPILALYKALLRDADMADLAIEDLRRWKLWEATSEVLAVYDQPKFAAKVMRNAVLRYALDCPDASAKAFIAKVREKDAALVSTIEERMKALEK